MVDLDLGPLRKAPLFAPLGEEEIRSFAEVAEVTEHAKGDTLADEGAFGHRFHVLLDGRAVVERRGERLAELSAGDFVGEIGLLGGGPSTATVRCIAPTRCITLEREAFWSVLQSEPEIALRILELVARRLQEEFRPGPH